MSFTVKLYTIEKYERSTKQPTGTGAEYECVANTPFSIMAPTLRLNTGDAVANYNYAYIPSVRRYYFIGDWSFNRGLWEADCLVDVLASWKSYIGDSTLYAVRSSNVSNGNIVDMAYPTTAKLDVVQKTFSLADADQLPWEPDGNGGGYVVGIVGYGGAVGYWYMLPAQYSNFMAAIFNTDIYDIQSEQEKRDFNPIQYIVSANWLPFKTSPPSSTTVKMGWWTVGGQGWYMGDAQFKLEYSGDIAIPKHPQAATRGEYMNTGSFSNYALQLPCFGIVEIPPALLLGSTTISVEIEVEMSTGTGILKVFASGRTQPIIIRETQVGCPVQISQVSGGFVGNAFNAVTAAVGRDSLAGEVVRGARSAISAVAELIPFVSAGESSVSTTGSTGARGMTKIQPALLATFTYAADEDVQHRGRPLCELKKVSTIPGFIQVADGDITAPCTAAELSKIKSYLEGGFFYE